MPYGDYKFENRPKLKIGKSYSDSWLRNRSYSFDGTFRPIYTSTDAVIDDESYLNFIGDPIGNSFLKF